MSGASTKGTDFKIWPNHDLGVVQDSFSTQEVPLPSDTTMSHSDPEGNVTPASHPGGFLQVKPRGASRCTDHGSPIMTTSETTSEVVRREARILPTPICIMSSEVRTMSCSRADQGLCLGSFGY